MRTESTLVEAVVSAHRGTDRDGALVFHPAWHDLDEEGRARAFDETLAQRAVEAARDPRGYSATTHAILRRLASR